MFDPHAYGEEIARILALDGNGERLMPLAGGTCSSPQARNLLRRRTCRRSCSPVSIFISPAGTRRTPSRRISKPRREVTGMPSCIARSPMRVIPGTGSGKWAGTPSFRP